MVKILSVERLWRNPQLIQEFGTIKKQMVLDDSSITRKGRMIVRREVGAAL